MRARLALALALLTSGVPSFASARGQRDLEYRYEQVFSAVVRYLRVDRRFAIDERDVEQGYILFQYDDRGRGVPASVELVRFEESGAPRVRLVVQLQNQALQQESEVLDGILAKLRADYGFPQRSQPPAGAVAAEGPRPLVPRLSPRSPEQTETPRGEDAPRDGSVDSPRPRRDGDAAATDAARSPAEPPATEPTPPTGRRGRR